MFLYINHILTQYCTKTMMVNMVCAIYYSITVVILNTGECFEMTI